MKKLLVLAMALFIIGSAVSVSNAHVPVVSLKNLFDTQIQTLRDRGVSKLIVEALTRQRGLVIAKARDMNFENGHVPFLPVIPRGLLSIKIQMSMVRFGARSGYSYIDQGDIQDAYDTPKNPYYIFDVEDGRSMLGKSPVEAEIIFKRNDRSGLMIEEAIFLAVHTPVLSDHFVDAVGSRRGDDEVANLWLDGGKPGLVWSRADSSVAEWGSASCGSRIGF